MAIKTDEEIRKEVKELYSLNPILQDLLKEAKAQMAEKEEAVDDFKKENTDNGSDSWDSEEWHKAFVIIEKHMDRLFGELRCITAEVERFSSALPKSGAETEELERQVEVISALTRALADRVDIMCENGIKDMDSQLDIIRIKRIY